MRLEENQKFAEMAYKINYEEYDTDADVACIDDVEVDRALPDGNNIKRKVFLYE